AIAAVLSNLRRVSTVFSILSSFDNATPTKALVLELNVFPGIGVSSGDCREHVLPFGGRDARTDRADDGVAEYRDKVVVLEDPALDLFGQRLSFGGIVGCEVSIVFGVEVAHAERIGGEEATAFEIRLIPVGPARANAGAGEDDVDPGPFLYSALPPLGVDGALQDLELATDANGLELRENALAPRIIWRRRSQPVHFEAIGIAGFCHQFL